MILGPRGMAAAGGALAVAGGAAAPADAVASDAVASDAVLLMSYGGPERLDQVEAFYTDIRRGSAPSPELLAQLIERYREIGGGSPLVGIVERQRAALEAELAARGRAIPVFAGMRHIEPRIGAVVAGMAAAGVRRFVAIALAPQGASTIGYRAAVEAALGNIAAAAAASAASPAAAAASTASTAATAAAASPAASAASPALPSAVFVDSWQDQPGFVEALAAGLREALARFSDPDEVRILFTAHSLPMRVVAAGDPYPDQVRQTAALVARRVGRAAFDIAFQSAGRTGEPWLGPDLRDAIRTLAEHGATDIIVCPVGFVADHLEVLYDIDIEAQAVARAAGVRLERTRSLNDDPTFIAALADLASAALGEPSPRPAGVA